LFVVMLISRLLRLFFHWLYHWLSFAYDLVAAVVSFGQWNDWGRAVLPYLEGLRWLELGHGPGYLQLSLKAHPAWSVGLDESSQMSRMAAVRLRRNDIRQVNLVRGLAQSLPFQAGSFDTIVSTFPSEYIFDPLTLGEVRRLLAPGGRLVALPVAWPSNRLLGWLFKFTGEAPSEALQIVKSRLTKPFLEAGFHVEIETLDVKSGRLLLIIAVSPFY
jgi:ubiquinone/menaquinone biosynthesis C-methylase UbiE